MKNVIKKFPFVYPSFWPVGICFTAGNLVLSMVAYMHYYKYSFVFVLFFFILLLFFMSLWWADLIVESVDFLEYTVGSRLNTRGGMVLFIISEVMFFASFFCAFFHLSFDPAIEIGGVWPPVAVQHSIGNVYVIPLVNTVLLLSSGVLVSWTHAIIHISDRSYDEAFFGLFGTLALAINFLAWQIYEFLYSPIAINDSVYGSTFYMLTGFHGFHVLMGTLMLIVCTVRQRYSHFVVKADGLDCAIWYWHFVDVVWLFLFIFVYLWGSHVI